MLIQVYSTKELPKELRTSFQLPTDPYDPVPERQELALKYLADFGIVFYRDEDHSRGVIIGEPEDEFEGFASTAKLSVEDGSVVSWPDKPGFQKKRQKYVENKGDDKSWLKWNEPVTVTSMDESKVTVV